MKEKAIPLSVWLLIGPAGPRLLSAECRWAPGASKPTSGPLASAGPAAVQCRQSGGGSAALFFDKLVIALVAPLGTALSLGALALLLALARRPRGAGLAGAVALSWLLAWSLPPVSEALRGSLEDDYPYRPAATLPMAPVAVVLGGGVDPPATSRVPMNLQAGADRVVHAARLWHAGRVPLLLLSGGADPALSLRSEAAVMAGLLRELGVPGDALLLETASRNTRQNAAYSAALLARRGVDRVLLVTSALHMARAVALFERAGLTVIPAATDHEAGERFPATGWLPDAAALEGSGRAFKEIVGRLAGR
mgnify:CR=1 FL=1